MKNWYFVERKITMKLDGLHKLILENTDGPVTANQMRIEFGSNGGRVKDACDILIQLGLMTSYLEMASNNHVCRYYERTENPVPDDIEFVVKGRKQRERSEAKEEYRSPKNVPVVYSKEEPALAAFMGYAVRPASNGRFVDGDRENAGEIMRHHRTGPTGHSGIRSVGYLLEMAA